MESREKVADDQIRLCAHMMPVSDIALSAVCMPLPFFQGLLFFFFFLLLLICHWFIRYLAKPNPERIPFENFI